MQGSSPSTNSGGSIGRVLILGHKGFIGGNLVKAFEAAQPEIEVLGRDYPELDLTRPEQAEELRALIDPKTAVVICAAIKKQLGDHLDAFTSNIQIATNVSRVLAKCAPGRVIYFSSAAVYGEDIHNTCITEETPVQPTSYYGLAKFTSEVLLRKATAALIPSPLVLLRPTLIYGPGDQGGYGPTGFIKSALAQEPIVLWGDGLEKREFIYVGDVARIVHALVFHPCTGILNLVSGQSYTFIDAIRLLNKLTGAEQTLNSRPRTKNRVDNEFDNSRLRQILPGYQFVPLAEGMRLTLEANRQAATAKTL
jgi:UDP-glucose 4-epimerase